MIKSISTEDLRRMNGKEGLVIAGCGGDLQEWVDGITDQLIRAEILSADKKFAEVMSFQYNDVACLLFPFEGMDLNIGKLAMWRLQTHHAYGGTWLSDFVPNRLNGFVNEEQELHGGKPDCPLIGQDGNIFNLIGIATRTLREAGQQAEAKEMSHRIMGGDCGSYEEALRIIGEYVNITSTDEMQMGGMDFG